MASWHTFVGPLRPAPSAARAFGRSPAGEDPLQLARLDVARLGATDSLAPHYYGRMKRYGDFAAKLDEAEPIWWSCPETTPQHRTIRREKIKAVTEGLAPDGRLLESLRHDQTIAWDMILAKRLLDA